MTRLAKLTDLFEEGKTVSVPTPAGGTLPLWINKMSPFEMEQANHEGRIARARTMLAIREVGSSEYDLYAANSAGLKPDAMIRSIVATKGNEHLVTAIRDLHADPEWKERLEVLDWSGEQVNGKADDDPEVLLLSKVLTEYQEALQQRTEYLADELRQELGGLTPEQVREHFLDVYVDEQGMRAFTRQNQRVQLFYSLRRCEAVKGEDGTWLHGACDHTRRWLEDVSEVDTLPAALLERVRGAVDDLNMPPDVARFSAGPASSSASHGPSSKQEASSPSTPVETSAGPDGISSSPSTKP